MMLIAKAIVERSRWRGPGAIGWMIGVLGPVFCAIAATPASAVPLLSVSGERNAGEVFNIGLAAEGVGSAFVLDGAFTDLSIEVDFECFDACEGAFLLSTAIGPDSGVLALLAVTDFADILPGGGLGPIVFSGLSLPAGTYFISAVIDRFNSGGFGLWAGSDPPVITSSGTASDGFDFLFPSLSGASPAFRNDFVEREDNNFRYAISGLASDDPPATIPEPAAIILLSAGLAGLGAALRRRARRH